VYSAGSGYGPVAGCFEHGNKPSGSMKCEEFSYHLSCYQLLHGHIVYTYISQYASMYVCQESSAAQALETRGLYLPTILTCANSRVYKQYMYFGPAILFFYSSLKLNVIIKL
jgi:hypothetical protein